LEKLAGEKAMIDTFYDQETGLEWRINPEDGLFTWYEAIKLGNDGWRLPTIDELKSIYLQKEHLKFNDRWWFWSSSPVANNDFNAWTVGLSRWHYKYHYGAVRLVRIRS
jgi:hypothetical protein